MSKNLENDKEISSATIKHVLWAANMNNVVKLYYLMRCFYPLRSFSPLFDVSFLLHCCFYSFFFLNAILKVLFYFISRRIHNKPSIESQIFHSVSPHRQSTSSLCLAYQYLVNWINFSFCVIRFQFIIHLASFSSSFYLPHSVAIQP